MSNDLPVADRNFIEGSLNQNSLQLPSLQMGKRIIFAAHGKKNINFGKHYKYLYQDKSRKGYFKKIEVKKQKEVSFRRYLKEIFETSLITSFPEIVSSRTFGMGFFRAMIFVACFAGYSYQTFDFMQYYYAYPTVMKIEESSPFEIDVPTLSFCSENRFSRIDFCTKNRSSCSFFKDKEKFCEKYPRYCYGELGEFYGIAGYGGGNYLKSVNKRWEIVQKYHSLKKNQFSLCEFTSGKKTYVCRYRLYPVWTAVDISPAFCLTIDGFTSDFNGAPNTMYYHIILKTYPEDYISYNDPVKMYVMVHNPKQIVFPYRDGKEIYAGYAYNGQVSKTETIRLPPPYDTKCTDYFKLWKENNDSGPLTQKECIEYCKMTSLLSTHHCVFGLTVVSHMEEFCPWTLRVDKDVIRIIERCREKCQPACKEELYDVAFRKTGYHPSCKNRIIGNKTSETVTNYSPENCWTSVIHINIRFTSFRLTRQIYEAKYKVVELFSYLGGFVGLWLGISFVSIFDFIGSLFRVFIYPFRNKNFKIFTV